jgi:ABC-2 type transport system ATP-binding protein
LELVGLADRANDRCKKYSKGMLQRLGLAQAMLHDPRLLILDEPTDGLDPGARAEMRQIIKRLKLTGVTIFLNSHLLQEVELVCDRVAILNGGQLRYCGGVSEIGDFVKSGLTGTDEVAGGILIVVEVNGDPDTVNAGFEGQTFAITERDASGDFTVKLTIADQAAIDELVDRLRGMGVSIRSLRRETVTLEDAFLEIVK